MRCGRFEGFIVPRLRDWFEGFIVPRLRDWFDRSRWAGPRSIVPLGGTGLKVSTSGKTMSPGQRVTRSERGMWDVGCGKWDVDRGMRSPGSELLRGSLRSRKQMSGLMPALFSVLHDLTRRREGAKNRAAAGANCLLRDCRGEHAEAWTTNSL